MSNQLHYNCLYHSKCRFYICMVFFRYCVRLWKISRCVSHDVNMTTKCWFLEWKLDPFSIFCIFFAFPAVWNTIQSIFFFFCLFHSVTKWNKKLTPDTEFSTKLNKQKKNNTKEWTHSINPTLLLCVRSVDAWTKEWWNGNCCCCFSPKNT